jgi:hypothetical protein
VARKVLDMGLYSCCMDVIEPRTALVAGHSRTPHKQYPTGVNSTSRAEGSEKGDPVSGHRQRCQPSPHRKAKALLYPIWDEPASRSEPCVVSR